MTRPSADVVALPQAIDPAAWEAEIAAGTRPRHVLLEIAKETGATVITASGRAPTRIDRMLGRFLWRPETWTVARAAKRAMGPEGAVYANSEGLGFVLLLLLGLRPSRSQRVGFYVMRPLGRINRQVLRLLAPLRLRPLLVSNTPVKVDQVRELVGVDPEQIPVELLRDPIDDVFFSPPATRVSHPRPLLASAGREARDYVTLAEAVRSLDVDVEVCAISPNAAASSAVLPTDFPPNLSFVDLSLVELRDLYRRADLTVVPMRPNVIEAGFTVAAEAMGCGCPIVVSTASGLTDLIDEQVAIGAGIEDPDALRAAIERALGDRDATSQMADAALAYVRSRHGTEQYVDTLLERLRERTGRFGA